MLERKMLKKKVLDKKTRKSNTPSSNTSSRVLNAKIIEILETVKSYYARERNTIHVNAYERAIYQIKKWPHPITNGKEVAHLEGIGKGMVEKINTILATGTLPIIQEKSLSSSKNISGTRGTKKNKEYSISNVLGFSEKSAMELEKKYGIKSIAELENALKQNMLDIKLTRIQQMGLRHHKDLQEKVSRAEITQIGNEISKILSREDVLVFLAGSYPSGLKKESKDIDILLVAKDSNKLVSKLQFYLEELVKKLETNIPLETITLGANKFLGLIKLPGANTKWRHLDMRLVDMSSFPYAWLYYASGVVFNKMIREKLKKKGYKLNEWGLFQGADKVFLEGEKSVDELEKQIYNKEDLLEYAEKIEKEIFKLANLEYKTISERY